MSNESVKSFPAMELDALKCCETGMRADGDDHFFSTQSKVVLVRNLHNAPDASDYINVGGRSKIVKLIGIQTRDLSEW